jgi:uncharacterized protein
MRRSGVLVTVLLLGCWSGRAQDKPSAEAATQKSTNSPGTMQPAEKSPIAPEKEKDIRRLLEVTGTKERMAMVMTEMEKSIRPMMEKSFPEGEYRDKLIEAFFTKFHSKLDLQQMLDLAVPIYDRYLSDEEVKALIQFYGTPLGQKTLKVLP